MSDSLWPHESQQARPPCPSPTPGVYPNSCPFSRWCHPAISSSVVPFSSCPPSLPASGSFPVSQLFARGGQSIGVSVSASVLPMNTQDWSHLGWTGWISLQSKGLSRVFSNTTVQKYQFFGAQLSSQSNSHIHTWLLEKCLYICECFLYCFGHVKNYVNDILLNLTFYLAICTQSFCCSVAKSCLTLCNPMDCSTLGFPVLHYLPELAQTHVHWVSDAIQPSHPLSSFCPPAFNLSQR